MKSLTGIFCLFLAFLPKPASASEADSIGIEKRDGQLFVLHKVDAKETMSAISRRYGVTLEELFEVNPQYRQGVQINQVVRVPYTRPGGSSYANLPKPKPDQSKPGSDESGSGKKIRGYQAQQGDNLYRIAQNFGMGLDEILDLNHLKTNSLTLGQILLVKIQPVYRLDSKNRKTEVLPPNVFSLENDSVYVRAAQYHVRQEKEDLAFIASLYDLNMDSLRSWNKLYGNASASLPEEVIIGYTYRKRNDNSHDDIANFGNLIKQAGIAEMIPESDEGNETPKRLALHAKIAVGTNVYVTNDTNGQRVLVRIIGKLSQNDINNNVIIKLSPAACKELSANTKQFRVTLMYNH